MEIIVEQRPPATVVRIVGSVDGLSAETLLAAFQTQVDGGSVWLVADLSQVDYTSSAGLRALLATMKQARHKGGDFRLAGPIPPVRRVLDLSGFTSILKVYADVDAAVASFAS